MAIDSLGREWQLGTAQLDYNMPKRFKLEYTDQNGEKQTPVMIHRAINGSIERFMSIAIEHFAGAFPAWLSPDQVVIIPVSDSMNDYAEKIEKELKSKHIRAFSDQRSESMQLKIKDAQVMKTPYMVIIGSREEESQTVSIRYRNEKKNVVMPLSEFVEKLSLHIENKNFDIAL